jgi:hypothetical protein
VLAAVPLDGAAAELLREAGAGPVVASDDVAGIRDALVQLHARFRDGGLPDVELGEDWRRSLSRRSRVEEVAELMRSVDG